VARADISQLFFYLLTLMCVVFSLSPALVCSSQRQIVTAPLFVISFDRAIVQPDSQGPLEHHAWLMPFSPYQFTSQAFSFSFFHFSFIRRDVLVLVRMDFRPESLTLSQNRIQAGVHRRSCAPFGRALAPVGTKMDFTRSFGPAVTTVRGPVLDQRGVRRVFSRLI